MDMLTNIRRSELTQTSEHKIDLTSVVPDEVQVTDFLSLACMVLFVVDDYKYLYLKFE